MNDNSSLMQTEQSWLRQLEEEDTQITANLNSAMPQGRVAIPTEIASIIDYIQRCEYHIRSTYEQPALRLNELGYSKLYQRVQAIVTDIRNTEQIYKKMYSSALAHQAQIANIQQGISNAWVDAIQVSMKNRQEVFDKTNKQWSANFTKSCVHCGYCVF